QHALFIMTYVRRHVPQREEAEDVLLDIFLAALEHPEIESFSEQKQLAWLQRVAYYKCIDYHRGTSRRSVMPLEAAADALVVKEELAPEQQAIRKEEEAVLYKKLAELPATYQEVLQLRFAYGLRCREIARRLDRSEGATRMLLSRALTLLRKVYTRQ
ncbi:MAG TPA: sigma-70 family RNA polymerase sigma factor, partial [Ktedonobacteraceae bacterium]|nr:sigma-70 family RNA polymerase sigma factor [Ktedonobacteraceae bacterium]